MRGTGKLDETIDSAWGQKLTCGLPLVWSSGHNRFVVPLPVVRGSDRDLASLRALRGKVRVGDQPLLSSDLGI